MRTAAPLAILLLLAGCIDVPGGDAPAASVDPVPSMPVEPFSAEGDVFLPPSRGQERVETLLPFPVNASGSAIAADLALGSRVGPLDVPPGLSDIVVELRAPDASVLAEGRLDGRSTSLHLDALANATGEHTLALLSYGGSDEEANGDHVEWRIEVTPP